MTPEPEHTGYRVMKGDKVVASRSCPDCILGRCECLLEIMRAARKVGAGARVIGPTGAELCRREKTK